MRAIQIVTVQESENTHASIAALGEDGCIYVRTFRDPYGPWEVLPPLPEQED